MTEKKDLRQAMPDVTAFIDDLRSVFGEAQINAVIRAGLQGKPNHFHAVENGIEVGTAFDDRSKEMK